MNLRIIILVFYDLSYCFAQNRNSELVRQHGDWLGVVLLYIPRAEIDG